ncbi:hypothetical protein I3760_02G063400 [Carya illinoinensis]|nr:hypothetical protein I3760_02G063400 [Carya illinoinensis]KAG2721051.1 hypothetical protein I3760_02G063400 [Carya illinoinensis]KAG2721052.1 hypothetical protein I3760_02G063400 [Carya illinoinensis]KAG2721053.1 hypothetical protein I3760_02G063400 [Carya illinoinensis]KAG2721055.1 hypothetical protein I3760_02G063400 [Carya illinoinensis]
MVRPKDPFWEHVDELENGRFLCKFCEGQFAGGITRIKTHLSGLKGNDIKVCEKVPQDIQLAVLQVLDTPNKKKRQVNVSKKRRKDRQVENENYSVPSSSSEPNLCMENDLIVKKLGKLFYSFGIHSKVIVSPIFEDFVKSIVEYGPSTYQLASTLIVAEEFEIRVEEEAEEYIENFINDSVEEGISLMVNIWQHIYYHERVDRVDIFAYSEEGVACFGSYKYEQRLGGIQEFISSKIDQELLRPNLHVVQLLLSQSTLGKDMDHEFLKIKNYYNRICVSHCAAVEIDKFLSNMQSDLNVVITLVGIIFFAYHYYNVSSKRETKGPKEKYAFILVMLKAVLEIEDELQDDPFFSIIEASDRVKILDEKEKAKHFTCAKLIDYIIGSKEFWNRVKAVKQVWFLLFQTRCLVNCKDSSIGYLYQMIERLKDGIEKSRMYDHFVYDHIWETFIHMRSKIIHPIHAAAAFLDPAYMCTKNFVENHEMINGTKYMLENMVDSKEKEAFEKELDQYREELPTLITAPAMIMVLKTFHPRTWWDWCGKHTPVLRKYAIRILALPCSTSLCKRYEMPLKSNLCEDWSTMVNTIIINKNSKLPEFEPIILDKLVENHDAFKDVTELDQEWHINQLFRELSGGVVVDDIINYPRLSFWDYWDDYIKPFRWIFA